MNVYIKGISVLELSLNNLSSPQVPILSLVIPLYNKEYSILKCLSSVLAQSIKPSEIIIVNDGSTDRSKEVVEEIISNDTTGIFKLINQPNGGVSVARNRGVEESSSLYVAFLDADDEWYPFFIEKALTLIERYPDADLLTFKHEVCDDNTGCFVPPQYFGKSEPEGYLDGYFLLAARYNLVNSSKVVVRRSALNRIGGFPQGGKVTEDLYVWSRLSLNGKFIYSTYLASKVNQVCDSSRIFRVNQIPYIIEFYSENAGLITHDLKLYLRRIFFNHLLGSKLDGNNYEFLLRFKSGYKLFPLEAILLLPLIFIPKHVFSLLKFFKRSALKSNES